MRNLSIVITIGAILAVTTVGYYGSDMLVGDEDNSLVSTDENNSGTEQASEHDNVLSENREIKGRDNKDAETEEESSADTTLKDGIIMSSNLVAGENARIVIYDEGNRVTGETVYLNGEEIGETAQTGALTFEVPDREEIKIESDEFSTTEKVEGYEESTDINARFVRPEDEQIEGYKVDVRAVIEASEDAIYRVERNGEEISRGEIGAEESEAFERTIYFQDSGEQKIEILDKSGSTVGGTTFVTTKNVPDIEVGLNNPANEAEIDNYWASFDYSINSSVPYRFELLIDEAVVESTELEPNQQLTSYRTYFNEQGTHSWEVRAESLETDQQSSKSRTFQTTEDAPVAEVELDYPTDNLPPGEEFTQGEGFRYSFMVEAFEDLNWKVYLVDGQEELEFEGELDEGQGQIVNTDPVSWEAGSYDWYVELESQETGEKLESEPKGFEVVE